MTKSSLMHLKIPFSCFLMPVFLLAACFPYDINLTRFALTAKIDKLS